MRHRIFERLFLLWVGCIFGLTNSFAIENPENVADVSLRFHAQWEISKVDKYALDKRYGIARINFDKQGKPIPQGLSPQHRKRWERLYNLCMSDGGCYCDANEGCCETGTCGPNNMHCKPYMDCHGRPKCGPVCADYAFAALLH